MAAKKPTFEFNKKLARYIRAEYRQENRRAKPPAFMDVNSKDGLSVNSLEVSTKNQIAAVYREKFPEDAKRVAICENKIEQYNDAAAGAGLFVEWVVESKAWFHSGSSGRMQSYIHDPKTNNDSHSLVKFTSGVDDFNEMRFAHRMARKPTFRLV